MAGRNVTDNYENSAEDCVASRLDVFGTLPRQHVYQQNTKIEVFPNLPITDDSTQFCFEISPSQYYLDLSSAILETCIEIQQKKDGKWQKIPKITPPAKSLPPTSESLPPAPPPALLSNKRQLKAEKKRLKKEERKMQRHLRKYGHIGIPPKLGAASAVYPRQPDPPANASFSGIALENAPGFTTISDIEILINGVSITNTNGHYGIISWIWTCLWWSEVICILQYC